MSKKKSHTKTFHHAFRIEYSNIMGVIVTKVFAGLPSALGAAGGPVSFRPYQGIWDTGATHSVITTRIVHDLSLVPCGKVMVKGINSQKLADQYLIDLGFIMGLHIPNWLVTENEINSPGADLLIGMDIIHNGDFSISNGTGKTIFSFAIPPFPSAIDLLQKANSLNPKKVRF